jgi:DNA repair exonuclease SbcCD ATPase subunit
MNSAQETIQVMQELQRVFSVPEDANTISEILKKRADCDKLILKKQTDAKKLIKDITTRIQQLENEAARREGSENHRIRLDTLERQKENINTNISEVEKQNQIMKQEAERLKKKTDELRDRKKQLESQRYDDVPRLKLYQCITNLKWDYDSARIKGHIDVVDHKRNLVTDVRPFEIDPAQSTSFEITNRLWDLMD